MRAIALRNLQRRHPGLASKLIRQKATDPETGEQTTKLDLYLKERLREGSEAYRKMVKRFVEQGHHPTHAEQAAQEFVERDVL